MESIQIVNRNSFEEVDLLNKQAEEARKENNNLSLTVSKEAISIARCSVTQMDWQKRI